MARGDDLTSVDALVVGGFGARGGKSSASSSDPLADAIAAAFERVGFLVARASGTESGGRRALADALFAAARDGTNDSDESRPRRVRVIAIVGLGAPAGAFVDAARCADFIADAELRWRVQHFAARGGVVLALGRGGAVDEIMRGWFSKPWTSGLSRAGASWRYNDDSAWGSGYFARFSAALDGAPPSALEPELPVVELESVGPADRVYYSSDISDTARTSVAFGAFGGGHVGCVGVVSSDPATVAVCAALAKASPGVATAASERQMRASPAAFRRRFAVKPAVWDESERVVRARNATVKPSVAAFACYVACTLTITTVFVAGCAKLVLNS